MNKQVNDWEEMNERIMEKQAGGQVQAVWRKEEGLDNTLLLLPESGQEPPVRSKA